MVIKNGWRAFLLLVLIHSLIFLFLVSSSVSCFVLVCLHFGVHRSVSFLFWFNFFFFRSSRRTDDRSRQNMQRASVRAEDIWYQTRITRAPQNWCQICWENPKNHILNLNIFLGAKSASPYKMHATHQNLSRLRIFTSILLTQIRKYREEEWQRKHD